MDSNEANLLVVAGSGCYILKFRLTRLYLDVWWFDDVPLVSHIKFIFVMELTRWYSSFLANRCFDHSDLLNFMVWFSYFVVHLGFSDGYYVPSIVLYGFELDQFNDVRFFFPFWKSFKSSALMKIDCSDGSSRRTFDLQRSWICNICDDCSGLSFRELQIFWEDAFVILLLFVWWHYYLFLCIDCSYCFVFLTCLSLMLNVLWSGFRGQRYLYVVTWSTVVKLLSMVWLTDKVLIVQFIYFLFPLFHGREVEN